MADLSNKYDIRHQIGKGSFGSAFLVTHKEEKKDYVLKRVRLAKQTKWQRNSTLQERDLVSMLRHPFIVPCVESWMVSDHTVNMIYGFCEKGDLASYLQKIQKQRGQVDEALMVKWLCQLLLALDYLQCKRVLHRDIKTSNLLLTAHMDVQLGDFGLATLMQGAGEGSMPQDTNLVGTPHYMSPELLSCKAYGFKTDVWSLGVVMYECTAQRPTFNAFNIHGLVSKIKKNKLPPLPESYSQEWRNIVTLMLQKNPERRPSVQELMALPALRPAMLQARALAQQLMPGVQLPPLLEPTPFVLVQRHSSSDAATDSDATSMISAGVARGCFASGSRTTVQAALQADELTELFRANSLQQEHRRPPSQQLQQLHEQQQEQERDQQQQGGLSETASEQWALATDEPSSRYSNSSRGSSRGTSLHLLPNTPPSAGVLDSCRRVAQPGIKRTPAERIAAAIAAARAAQAETAAGGAAQDEPAPLCSAEAAAGSQSVPRLPLAAVSAATAVSAPPASSSERSRQPAASAGAGNSSSRPRSGALSARGAIAAGRTPRKAEKPAWRMSGNSSAKSASNSAKQQQQQRIKSATAASKEAAAAGALSGGRSGHSVPSATGPAAQRGFLQQLQEQGSGDSPEAAGHGSLPARRRLPGSQAAGLAPLAVQPQQEQCIARAAAAAPAESCSRADQEEDDEDDSSCCGGDSAIKQLRFDSTSPGVSSRRMSEAATPSDYAGVASTPGTCDAASPMSTDVLAAAGAGAATAGQDDSPVLWSMPGTSHGVSRSSSTAAARQTSSWAANTDSSSAAVFAEPAAGVAGDAAAVDAAAGQRLELLESVVQLLGSLYSRGRWRELGSVLATPGLLQDSLRPAVQASRSKRSLAEPAAGGSSRGAPVIGGGGGSRSPARAAQLRLGDVVVLGSKRIRGKIRYIGPVAWDASGQDWVGMALDTPCGMDSVQAGISYFDCPPGCAAFHKASLLTSRPPGGKR